jgi:serine/threonine protein kinase
MLQALDFLDSHNQCHRDVKPENILYSDMGQKKYLFQLADFGFACDASQALGPCGTFPYMAPELYYTSRSYVKRPKMDV